MKNCLLAVIIFTSSFLYSQTGTTTSVTFTSGGVTRTFTYYVPAIYYTANKPVPLILNIHGWTGSSMKQESYADFRKIADTANFIVVHPQALPQSGFNSWNTTQTYGPSASDKVYLMQVLDTLIAKFKINPKRIYSTGFSQGGLLSYDMACFYSTRFAAIASVSAGMSTSHRAICNPQHPMPIMEIHGTKDQLATYTGSGLSIPVDSVIRYWVNFNGCDTTPSTVANLPDINTTDSCHVVHYVYTGGAQGATVELYKVINGDHQWPADSVTTNVYGVGFRNKDFNASKEIWRFFSKYLLTVGIDEQAAEDINISIYPNPTNGVFTMELKNNVNSDIKIVNILGETIVMKNVTDNKVTVDLSGYAAGVYFYQVMNKAGILGSGKLVVQ